MSAKNKLKGKSLIISVIDNDEIHYKNFYNMYKAYISNKENIATLTYEETHNITDKNFENKKKFKKGFDNDLDILDACVDYITTYFVLNGLTYIEVMINERNDHYKRDQKGCKEMTINEIEEELGHPVIIVYNKEKNNEK